MALFFRPVSAHSADFTEISALYANAFPEAERIPLPALLARAQLGDVDFFGIYDAEQWIGLLYIIHHADVSLILYFAVREELRGHSYGGQALQALRERYPNRRMFLDIEAPDDSAPNYEQRRRRREFYLRRGFVSAERCYSYKGITYEILNSGGDISRDECRALIRAFRAKLSD